MQFKFKLEGLLRVRHLLEQQARQRLDECLMRIRSLEHRIAEAREWSDKTSHVRASKRALPAAELQFIESVLCQTRQAIADCRLQMQREVRRASELRAAYMEIARERKTLDTLRENARTQFETEQSRREQSELDEISLVKFARSRIPARNASEHHDPVSSS